MHKSFINEGTRNGQCLPPSNSPWSGSWVSHKWVSVSEDKGQNISVKNCKVVQNLHDSRHKVGLQNS